MQRRMLISDICRALKLQYEGSDIEINGLNYAIESVGMTGLFHM